MGRVGSAHHELQIASIKPVGEAHPTETEIAGTRVGAAGGGGAASLLEAGCRALFVARSPAGTAPPHACAVLSGALHRPGHGQTSLPMPPEGDQPVSPVITP